MEEEMEMPTPCQRCGYIFDLHDGACSQKWFPNTIICHACWLEEEREIDRDERIEELKETIENAEYDIREAKKELQELGVEIK